MAKTYTDVRSLLQQHREQKAAQERREKLKKHLRQPWKLLYNPEGSTEEEIEEEEEDALDEEEERDFDRKRRKSKEIPQVAPPMTPRQIFWWRVRLAAKIVVWLSVWLFFVYVEFGAVFFIFSCLYFIYANLGQKDKGPSAYSVFNADCERLQGTFTAEEFDAGLRSGMGLVR